MRPLTVAQQIRYSTVRIETDTGTGTGFFYAQHVEEGYNIVLVTNKHVIRGAKTGLLHLIKMNDDSEPTTDSVDIMFGDDGVAFETNWYGHPDTDIDVAVLAFGEIIDQLKAAGHPAYTACITDSMCPTAEQIETLDAIETVLFVGYPDGLIDTVNHMPVARQGITATPIAENWCGKPQMLIDASVFPGSSGSPVFTILQGARPGLNGTYFVGGPTTYFLGIVAAVHQRVDTGEIVVVTQQRPLAVVRQMIDLGIVYKAETVNETVDHYRDAIANGTLPKPGTFNIVSRAATPSLTS